MKKIWLSVALASSSLFLTACNDDHDDTSVVVIEDGIPKYNFSAPSRENRALFGSGCQCE